MESKQEDTNVSLELISAPFERSYLALLIEKKFLSRDKNL
jgi:hypothetical protein